MEITKLDPTKYIESLEPSLLSDIKELDKEIRKIVGKARRVMWEGKFWGGSEQKIIGYGKIVYVGSNKKEVEWFVIGLAQQKNYITVFVNVANGREYIAEKYKKELKGAKIGKSSISFKKLSDINRSPLIKVIKEAWQISQKN